MKFLIMNLLFIFTWPLMAAPSIVYVHIGPLLPVYLSTSIRQARVFNPDCRIYLIASQMTLDSPSEALVENDVELIPFESLQSEPEHQTFLQNTPLTGFWRYTIERFFYLDAWMRQYSIQHAFHMENDVMLYADLEMAMPIFEKYYSGKIGATFDSDDRCIPGFLYISDPTPLKELARFIAAKAPLGGHDMVVLSQFREIFQGILCDSLPILMPTYDHPLQNQIGGETRDRSLFSRNFESFKAIFDAAALGQYWGGIDPIHGLFTAGFINETCLFNPCHFQFVWEKDLKGRNIPYFFYKTEKYPIFNLHVHCKNLDLFYSLNPNPMAAP